MNWKTIAAGAALISAMSGRAYAQTLETGPATKETKIVRLSDSYKGLSGFVDIVGKSPRIYSEVYLRHKAVQLEFNGGSGMDSVYRAGYAVDIPVPKNIKLSAKFLPLATTKHGLRKEFQFGASGSIEGKGLYMENWTDLTSGNKTPGVMSEFTGGKYLTKNFALEAQAAYNVNTPGWVFRAGARLKIK